MNGGIIRGDLAWAPRRLLSEGTTGESREADKSPNAKLKPALGLRECYWHMQSCNAQIACETARYVAYVWVTSIELKEQATESVGHSILFIAFDIWIERYTNDHSSD